MWHIDAGIFYDTFNKSTDKYFLCIFLLIILKKYVQVVVFNVLYYCIKKIVIQ
jgi:hypothetical protein